MGRESYQVRVHVIEARQLKGTDESAGFSCNPVAKLHLTAGEGATLIDKTQHTRKENETNTVWWDETKIFSEEFSREQFLSAKLEASCARRTRALPRLSTATPRAVPVGSPFPLTPTPSRTPAPPRYASARLLPPALVTPPPPRLGCAHRSRWRTTVASSRTRRWARSSST